MTIIDVTIHFSVIDNCAGWTVERSFDNRESALKYAKSIWGDSFEVEQEPQGRNCEIVRAIREGRYDECDLLVIREF